MDSWTVPLAILYLVSMVNTTPSGKLPRNIVCYLVFFIRNKCCVYRALKVPLPTDYLVVENISSSRFSVHLFHLDQKLSPFRSLDDWARSVSNGSLAQHVIKPHFDNIYITRCSNRIVVNVVDGVTLRFFRFRLHRLAS